MEDSIDNFDELESQNINEQKQIEETQKAEEQLKLQQRDKEILKSLEQHKTLNEVKLDDNSLKSPQLKSSILKSNKLSNEQKVAALTKLGDQSAADKVSAHAFGKNKDQKKEKSHSKKLDVTKEIEKGAREISSAINKTFSNM